MRRRAIYLCSSLLGACIGPGLEPPRGDQMAMGGAAGSRAGAADGKTPNSTGTSGTPPPGAAPAKPTTGETAARDASVPRREDDAGTDDSGIGP